MPRWQGSRKRRTPFCFRNFIENQHLQKKVLVFCIRKSFLQIDLDAVDFYTVVGADQQVLDAADDARLDKVGALGVDLNGHIRCFELELLCVNQVRRAERRVGAEVLVKLDVEFCKLRFLHAAAGEHLGNLLPAHDKRLVRF